MDLLERIQEFLAEATMRGLYHVAGSGPRQYQADPFTKQELKYFVSPEKEVPGFKLKKRPGYRVYTFKSADDADEFAGILDDGLPKGIKVDQKGPTVTVYKITRQT